MKYLKQVLLILAFSFLGEMLSKLIPVPVPAAIYGLVLLFLALQLGLIKRDDVQETGNWMISILPLLFVAPGVNILGSWDLIAGDLLALAAVMLLATIVVYCVVAVLGQLLSKGRKNHG